MTKRAESQYNNDITLPSIAIKDDDLKQKAAKRLGETGITFNTPLELHLVVDGKCERKPDQVKLKKNLEKVLEAERAAIPEWERDLLNKNKYNTKKSRRRLARSNSQYSQSSVLSLERKLSSAIVRYHADPSELKGDSKKKIELRQRDLVPHYKLVDIKNFLNAFFGVDKNLSGYLDIEEWVEFFQTLNESMSAHSARQLFSHIDSDGDGILSLKELIPVIFAEASSKQLSLITKFVEDEASRNMKLCDKQLVYKKDIKLLFEAYDTDDIGYIKVQHIRDKLMRFQLPVAAQLAFNEKLKGIEDDDMVNLAEFTRLFIAYLTLDNKTQISP